MREGVMPKTSPLLIFSGEDTPVSWCYFDLNADNTLSYYTAPYGKEDATFEVTVLPDAPLYVYNPKTKERFSYAVYENKLYEVPIQVVAGNEMSK